MRFYTLFVKYKQIERGFFVFYDNLKAECDRQGLKITPFVEECGGNRGSLSGWKKGASPNSDIVMKIAVRLNVSTDYLLFGKERKEQTELTEKEQELLDVFRELNDIGQECIIHDARRTREDVKYQKYTDIPKEA